MFKNVLVVKATIIHPATEKHVQKYSIQTLYMVNETYEIYEEITLPCITKEQFNLQVIIIIRINKTISCVRNYMFLLGIPFIIYVSLINFKSCNFSF